MGLDAETLTMILDAIRSFAAGRLPDERLLELDARDEFPEDEIRAMCSQDLGVHLLFIPEAYGGMAGDAVDTYRVCEQMAAIDVGVATGVFATFLGSEPIMVGGTPEQQKRWLSRIAEEGLLFAYGATEPKAGSDLGALRTRAEPVERDGKVAGYVLTGKKQWISNGGVADAYCVLANAPGGPSWFVVEKIKRDVRITTIYEGTSEIMEMTIGRDRWQLHLKTRGEHYHSEARELETLHAAHPEVGADTAALAAHALAALLEHARIGRLTRHQHVLFRLGELLAVAEGAASFASRAARAAEGALGDKADRRFPPDVLAAMSRVNARDAALKVAADGLRWVGGALATGEELAALQTDLDLPATQREQAGLLGDMDRVRDALYGAPAR